MISTASTMQRCRNETRSRFPQSLRELQRCNATFPKFSPVDFSPHERRRLLYSPQLLPCCLSSSTTTNKKTSSVEPRGNAWVFQNTLSLHRCGPCNHWAFSPQIATKLWHGTCPPLQHPRAPAYIHDFIAKIAATQKSRAISNACKKWRRSISSDFAPLHRSYQKT